MYFCVRGACLSCMELGWAPWAWRAGREQERWEQILQRQSAAPMPRRPLWPAHACAPHLLPPAHAYMRVSALLLSHVAPATGQVSRQTFLGVELGRGSGVGKKGTVPGSVVGCCSMAGCSQQ